MRTNAPTIVHSMRQAMRRMGRLFFRGFTTLAPIVLTLLILHWMIWTAESFLGRGLRALTGERFYVPGMGVIAASAITLGVGYSLRYMPLRRVFFWTAILFDKIPLIKSIYGSIHDLVGFFDASQRKKFNKVVMVDLIDSQVRILGLVTREDFTDVPEGVGDSRTVAVYIPMSYQMGGFTVVVPRERVQAVDMGVDQAFQFALTAAVSSGLPKAPTEEAVLGPAVAAAATEGKAAQEYIVEEHVEEHVIVERTEEYTVKEHAQENLVEEHAEEHTRQA